MKILLLTNKDVASNLAINYLFNTIGQSHCFKIFLSSAVGNSKKTKPQSLIDLAFFEQGLFNQILYPALTLGRSPAQDKLLSFDGFATKGVEVTDIYSINSEASIKQIHDFAPDLIISIRFGLILQADVIAIPQFGVINLHSGELPKYRGVMATFRAMLDNSSQYATTLHYILDNRIDNGDIITISYQPLNLHRSYLANTLNLYQQGIQDVVNAIEIIEKTGKCHSYSVPAKGDYYSFPTENELKTFFTKGFKLYNYQDVIDIAQAYY